MLRRLSSTIINLKYYISEEEDESDIVAAVEDDGGAIDQYKKWQCAKITRDINPDKLKGFIIAAGAKRVDITSPVYKDLGVTSEGIGQLAKFSGTYNIEHAVEGE